MTTFWRSFLQRKHKECMPESPIDYASPARNGVDMNRKVAMPKTLPELPGCTGCHGYTQNGYELRDNNVSRFVCEDCYRNLSSEYSLCGVMIEIRREVLSKIAPNDRKPTFQAGYLLGKKETVDNVQKVVVVEHFNSLQSGKGTVVFFSPADVMRVRKIAKEKNCVVVGLFRTNPSGSPDFNALDNKTLSDMVSVMPYVIIGGTSEIQISARDKNYPAYEYGVTVV